VERYKTLRTTEYRTVRGKGKKRIETKQRLRPATINRELACLRAMFNHAIKSDLPLKNPISKTGAKALREDNEQTRVLVYDEQGRYLARATPTLWNVASLMLETGMRAEEVYRIQPQNVHLADDYPNDVSMRCTNVHKLGSRLGTDPAELLRMINGRVVPTKHVIAGLAPELNIDPSYLQ
jgi:site-specific recombinase XerD